MCFESFGVDETASNATVVVLLDRVGEGSEAF